MPESPSVASPLFGKHPSSRALTESKTKPTNQLILKMNPFSRELSPNMHKVDYGITRNYVQIYYIIL